MSQTGVLIDITSVDGTDFAATVAQNAGLLADLPARGLGPATMSNIGIVRTLRIMSSAQHAWEVNFFSSDQTTNADPNVDSFLGRYPFSLPDGVQIAAAGLFRYYVDSLQIPALDRDNTGELHVVLVPRDAAKGAGETIRLAIGIEPMGAWG
jgi:hypothetical protein